MRYNDLSEKDKDIISKAIIRIHKENGRFNFYRYRYILKTDPYGNIRKLGENGYDALLTDMVVEFLWNCAYRYNSIIFGGTHNKCSVLASIDMFKLINILLEQGVSLEACRILINNEMKFVNRTLRGDYEEIMREVGKDVMMELFKVIGKKMAYGSLCNECNKMDILKMRECYGF